MKRIRISIIIPAYNEARYLPACLTAIAAQTVRPYEVIVVDNNSTDATAKVACSQKFVKVVHGRQRGIAYARNAGFTAATGTVLARIDADTRLPNTWVARVQSFYDSPERARDVLTGGSRFYDLRFGDAYGRLYDFVVHRMNRLLLGYYFPWGSNCVIPQQVWQQVSTRVSERADIHEDFDLGVCLHDAGFRIVYQPGLRVGVAARILRQPARIWAYLSMWPRGYKMHRLKVWPIIWILACGVWVGSLTIIAADWLSGSPPDRRL